MAPKPTALVVEDDDIQRSIVAFLLEECEMEVIECNSGEDAARVPVSYTHLTLPTNREV